MTNDSTVQSSESTTESADSEPSSSRGESSSHSEPSHSAPSGAPSKAKRASKAPKVAKTPKVKASKVAKAPKATKKAPQAKKERAPSAAKGAKAVQATTEASLPETPKAPKAPREPKVAKAPQNYPFQTKAQIRSQLSDPKFAQECLLRLATRQTEDELEKKGTIYRNRRGFQAAHAKLGTELATAVAENKVTPETQAQIFALVGRYTTQLAQSLRQEAIEKDPSLAALARVFSAG